MSGDVTPLFTYAFTACIETFFFHRKETVAAGSTFKKVKLSLHVMKAYTGSGGTVPVILNPKVDAGEWSASHPDGFTPRERALRCP